MTTETNITGWLTLEETAREMKTTKLHLLMMVKRGLLRGREVDGEWYVDPREIDATKTKPESAKIFSHNHCNGHGGCGGCK